MFLNLINDEALKDRMEEIIESVLDDESLKVAQPATYQKSLKCELFLAKITVSK